MGALSTLTYAILQRALHKLLKYVQCNTMLDKTRKAADRFSMLYLDSKAAARRLIYSFFTDRRHIRILENKKTNRTKTYWYENAASQ